MTMDYGNQSRADIKMPSPRISSADGSVNHTKLDFAVGKTGNIKRSFDVAFLMLPDEKMKNKLNSTTISDRDCGSGAEKQPRLSADAVVTYPSQQISVKSDESLRHVDNDDQPYFDHVILNGHKISRTNSELEMINGNASDLITNNNNNNNNNNDSIRSSRFAICQQSTRLARIYDDPTICMGDVSKHFTENDMPKSAFTKVPHHTRQQPESPIPSSSPDQLSCPSNSPPISTSPPRHIIYQQFRPEYRFVNSGQFHTISQLQAAQNHKFKQQFMYRPMHSQNGSDMSSGGGGGGGNSGGYMPTAAFPFASAGGHPFVPVQPDLSGIVRHPAAAALLTSLIPPTIATSFTLTAQNVCAKCNISFRMTSDLVYHMRSHHKSEFTSDTNRRKREEKLKCPVCNESFRERHHLTRHMTAHQDKASDEAETIQLHRRHK